MMGMSNLSILQAVFESTADGILIVDNNGKVIQFNNRFHELWKIPKEILETSDDDKILGYILCLLVDPDKFISKVRELYKDLEAISHDTIEFKDGRYFERFSRPLKFDQATVGRVWSFRDITEHKKGQEVFKAIADLSPDIISIVTPQGKLTFNSSASERIHGYAQDELLGKNTMNLIHQDDRELVAGALADLIAKPGAISTVQYRYLNKDRSYSWMEATASNQNENRQIQGLVVISREIGIRKQMEQELNKALRLRDEFISIASHELKTPVTSIKLQLQIIQRTKKILLPRTEASSKAEDLDGLLDQVESLQRLIEDLLSVSRIRTGNINFIFSNENLSQLIQKTIQLHSDILSNSSCALEIDILDDVYIRCDKMRIEQLLINLLSNSAKYASGSLIIIQLKQVEGFAELRIIDKGIGIPSEKIDTIFDIFERGTNSKYASGLGIGLYISKNIVEGHHGTIHVESKLGEGSTFIVRLPKIT
jgi:PAS domain S-box-containing protein